MALITKAKPHMILLEKANKENGEFRKFLNNYNVAQLAVGVVVGNAAKDLVTSISNNLLMPIIGILTPSGSWRDISLNIAGADLKLGLLFSSILDFLIIAFVVFLVVKKILRIELEKTKNEARTRKSK